jgi:cystathionine beta-synthase
MRYSSALAAIGNTPLIQVNLGTPPIIYAKLEYFNPGGSIKDRAARFMIEEAERQGILKPGGTLIEASSGNQGIAAAMIGAIKGYRVVITVSEKVSREKKDTLRAYGAELVICPSTNELTDPESYHSRALALNRATPNSYLLNQYFNPHNAEAHYRDLGPEIWRQTEGTLTHYIGALGTGGTVCGAGKYLREQKNTIRVVGVDAATSYRATNGHPSPYKLEGIGVDFDGPLLDPAVMTDYCTATDEESIAMLKELARHQGLLVGPSSGAVAAAARRYTAQLTPSDIVVMVFGDSGRAYLTKHFYDSPESYHPAHEHQGSLAEKPLTL